MGSPLEPINDLMMVVFMNHDFAMIEGETPVGGAVVEESQLLPNLNIGLVYGEAEERRMRI